jgi:hypothetical protein
MINLIKLAIDASRRGFLLSAAGVASGIVSKNIGKISSRIAGKAGDSISDGLSFGIGPSPLEGVANVTKTISNWSTNIAKFRKMMIDRVKNKSSMKGMISSHIAGKVHQTQKPIKTAKKYIDMIDLIAGKDTRMRTKLMTAYNISAKQNSLPRVNAENVNSAISGLSERAKMMKNSYSK